MSDPITWGGFTWGGTAELEPGGEVTVVRVGVIGLDGESADAVRMAAIEADLAEMLGRPVIVELASIPDVDTTGVADGNALLYDAANAKWIAGPVSGAIARIEDTGTVKGTDISTLNFQSGLMALADGVGRMRIEPIIAGTGSGTMMASWDHWHTTPTFVSVPYAASGTLSSGSRVLASTNVTIPSGITARVKLRVHSTQRANGSESGYYKLFLNIDSGAATQESQIYQCVGFVPAPQTFEHSAVVVGNGTARLMSASIIYSSGVGSLVDAGQFIVEVDPTR